MSYTRGSTVGRGGTAVMAYEQYGTPMALYGFGAPRTCAQNATYDAESDICNCNPGFDIADNADASVTPCTPVNPLAPCANPSQRRSPVTGHCVCPPGSWWSDPASDNCMPVNLFPGCKDAAGNTVPGCVLGVPIAGALPAAVMGIAVGSLLAWLVLK